MNLLDRIKTISKQKGLSLRTVNERAGLGPNAIYKWKNTSPSFDKLEKVAKVLDVTPNYLLGREDHSSSAPVDLLDGVRMYNGKPINDQEKEMIKALLDAYRKGDD